jgi:glycosyltransferase involved in cell wall biosynthesis
MDESKPTICQVLHSLNVGGAEVLAARLARGLSPDFRYLFACLDELGSMGEQLRDEGFQVEVLNRRPGLDFRVVKELQSLARRERVDLFHAHQYTPFFYCAAGAFAKKRPPILFTEHGRWHPDLPSRKRMAFNRCFLRRKDRVIGVGETVRQALIKNEGIPSRRVGVIYNGVDLRPYDDPRPEKQTVRSELGLAAGDFVIIQVARLDHLKDHPTAIRTIERLSASTPSARLLLVGAGPEQAPIEKEIAQRNLQSRVTLLGLRSDIPRLLAAADAFLLTSISEGIPLTLIEAMAARVPIVSTGVGGVYEVVGHEETALIAPAGDDAALAAALQRLASDPLLAKRLADAGRVRAHECFSEVKMHAEYRRLYEEMILAPALA